MGNVRTPGIKLHENPSSHGMQDRRPGTVLPKHTWTIAIRVPRVNDYRKSLMRVGGCETL